MLVTCRAGVAITKGRFVKLSDSVDFTVVTAGAGEVVFGVAGKAASAAGDYIPVCVFGRVKMDTGGNITAGNRVQSDAAGLPVVHSTGAVAGVATQTAVSGDEIVVFLGLQPTVS